VIWVDRQCIRTPAIRARLMTDAVFMAWLLL
jgi:hypothetical protein